MIDLNKQLKEAAKVAYENGFKQAYRICKQMRSERLKNASLIASQ